MWLLLLACVGEPPKYPAVAEALMARADLDGDGVVDAAEYAALSRSDEPMVACDSNGDAVIDVVELEGCFLTVNPTRLQAERRRAWTEASGEGAPEERGKQKAGKPPGERGERGERGKRDRR